MNPEQSIKARQDALAEEMEALIEMKNQYEHELARIETRMTQIVGGMQVLSQLAFDITTVNQDYQQEAASVPAEDLRPSSPEPQVLSRPSQTNSVRSKGRHKRKTS